MKEVVLQLLVHEKHQMELLRYQMQLLLLDEHGIIVKPDENVHIVVEVDIQTKIELVLILLHRLDEVLLLIPEQRVQVLQMLH
jgi:hypothetical protein